MGIILYSRAGTSPMMMAAACSGQLHLCVCSVSSHVHPAGHGSTLSAQSANIDRDKLAMTTC